MITFDVDKVKRREATFHKYETRNDRFFKDGFGKFGIKAGTIEAYKLNTDQEVSLDTPGKNWFFETCLKAYDEHLPLVLGPDEVWLAMLQAVSKHIELNPEDCRKALVDFEGKKTLTVQADYLVKGSAENAWHNVFAGFGEEIEKYVGKKRDLFDATFSTTGPIEQAAIRVQMMAALSPFFDYRCRTMCGIPQVTLLGEIEDWAAILSRVNALGELYPKWAHEPLQYVAAEFVKASAGKPTMEFWQNFVKVGRMSGGNPVAGYINAFFPYVGANKQNKYLINGSDSGVSFANRVLLGKSYGPNAGELPSSCSVVPMLWVYHDTNYNMKLATGIFGTSIDRNIHKDGGLRPVIGWAIGEASE